MSNNTFYPDEVESLAEWGMSEATLLRRESDAPTMYDAGDTVLYLSHNATIIEWNDGGFRTVYSDEAISKDLACGPALPHIAKLDGNKQISKSQHRQGATMRYTVNYTNGDDQRISKAQWDNLNLPITEYIP